MKSASSNTFPNHSKGAFPGVVYHCVCGFEFRVDPNIGGECAHCKRTVKAEALQSAMSATVSISNLLVEEEVHHHFEFDEAEQIGDRNYGHFRLDRKLGSGGMGSVFRALDTSLQRYVAVKVMRNAGQCVDSRIASMLREAVAQARLNHPNVVTIYYVGRQEEEPFLAMELIAGPTLAEKLKSEGSIAYADAIRYAIQVASAMDHASQFGIVHADIKPGNLLMAGEGRIKLSDFGLSRIQSDPGRDNSFSGTPAYVAPELIQGGEISPQSDMYALGVTLFELVFGRLPFELRGESVRERIETHLSAVIEYPQTWPSNIPREFADVINRLLAKDPKDRYQDYDELIDDLKLIEPVSTTTAGLALRAMAYCIDQLALLLCISPFAFTIFFLNSDSPMVRGYQWMTPIVAFISLVVPAVYLILIYRGWRSIGRYLFQLNIVEENGLPPRREQLVSREVLRNAFAWFFPLLLYVDPNRQDSHMVSRVLEGILVLFLAIDWATTLMLKGRKSLHDYLCRSSVVLAVDRDSKSK
jgi:eukaryotic-like serine/threonine-protein kinase